MAFQNFFSNIMRYANPNFVPVKPQGNQGDWKNDGHDPKAGRYYQVYSPEMFDEAASVKKLAMDFAGLMGKWGDKPVYPNGVREFWFVLSDHYCVTPARKKESAEIAAEGKESSVIAELVAPMPDSPSAVS